VTVAFALHQLRLRDGTRPGQPLPQVRSLDRRSPPRTGTNPRVDCLSIWHSNARTTPAGRAAPMSAIAAAPLPPRPRGNQREKRPHSLRSIAAEISDCCRQYHASFPAISRVFIDGSLSPVAEPSSCAADPGASPIRRYGGNRVLLSPSAIGRADRGMGSAPRPDRGDGM